MLLSKLLLPLNNRWTYLSAKISGSKKPVDLPTDEIYAGHLLLPEDTRYTDWISYRVAHTLHYFQSSLLAPAPHQKGFAAKVKIAHKGREADTWITNPSFDGHGHICGIVANRTRLAPFRKNEKIIMPVSSITDWMIIEDGYLTGGYSIRKGLNTIGAYRKKKLLQLLPYKYDHGHDHFLHDFNTPEGALLCLGDAIDARDEAYIQECRDFYREAIHLLNTTNDPEIPDTLTEELIALWEKKLTAAFLHLNLQPDLAPVNKAKRAFYSRRDAEHGVFTVCEVRTCYNPDITTLHEINVQETPQGWKVLSHINDLILSPQPEGYKGPIIDLSGNRVRMYDDENDPRFIQKYGYLRL
ncbi:DUF2314 domain-containing protein [Chitinophaga sp. Hz27]|uniref:DUF2314 domain-containing protein n=1 Tax=Chitinophaga sp. Hz27 TaxID=3347169 RepID=UPI0035DC5F90